jgi:hypothetical protein
LQLVGWEKENNEPRGKIKLEVKSENERNPYLARETKNSNNMPTNHVMLVIYVFFCMLYRFS